MINYSASIDGSLLTIGVESQSGCHSSSSENQQGQEVQRPPPIALVFLDPQLALLVTLRMCCVEEVRFGGRVTLLTY